MHGWVRNGEQGRKVYGIVFYAKTVYNACKKWIEKKHEGEMPQDSDINYFHALCWQMYCFALENVYTYLPTFCDGKEEHNVAQSV